MKNTKESILWLSEELGKASLVMSDKAKESFLERTDFNPERLQKEFYKFLLLKPDVITAEMVEQLVPASYSERYFDLLKAGMLRDSRQVITLFYRVRQQEGAEYKLLKFLFRFWEQAYSIFSYWERGIRDPAEIAQYMELPKFMVKRTLRVLELLNLRKIRVMLSVIYGLDKQVRSFRTDPFVLLENYFLTLGETCTKL